MLAQMTLGLLLTAASLPLRGTESRLPSRPTPEFAVVSAVDENSGEVKLLQVRAVTVTNPVPGPKGEVRYVVRTELRTVQKKVMLGKASVFDAAGKKLAGKAMWGRFKKGDTVLLSTDGQAVDPAYLRAVLPSTLVLVVEPEPGQVLPPPLPPPAGIVPPARQ